MNTRIASSLAGLVALVSVAGTAWSAAAADLVHAKDGSGVYGYKDTPKLPWCGYLVHDPDRPAPPRVNPGPASALSPVPVPAVVLFDGKDLSQWHGEWQIFDIVFTAPVFEAGKLVKPARVTLFHNGLLAQLNEEIHGETGHRIVPAYQNTRGKGPLVFGGHDCPVRFRNVWVRPL